MYRIYKKFCEGHTALCNCYDNGNGPRGCYAPAAVSEEARKIVEDMNPCPHGISGIRCDDCYGEALLRITA